MNNQRHCSRGMSHQAAASRQSSQFYGQQRPTGGNGSGNGNRNNPTQEKLMKIFKSRLNLNVKLFSDIEQLRSHGHQRVTIPKPILDEVFKGIATNLSERFDIREYLAIASSGEVMLIGIIVINKSLDAETSRCPVGVRMETGNDMDIQYNPTVSFRDDNQSRQDVHRYLCILPTGTDCNVPDTVYDGSSLTGDDYLKRYGGESTKELRKKSIRIPNDQNARKKKIVEILYKGRDSDDVVSRNIWIHYNNVCNECEAARQPIPPEPVPGTYLPFKEGDAEKLFVNIKQKLSIIPVIDMTKTVFTFTPLGKDISPTNLNMTLEFTWTYPKNLSDLKNKKEEVSSTDEFKYYDWIMNSDEF